MIPHRSLIINRSIIVYNINKLSDIVLSETSGKYAWDWVAKITQYNRMRGSKDYHEIVERIVKELNSFDLDEVKIHFYPADGVSKSWEWIAPLGWDVKSAELKLIEPENEIICRYKETPMCVIGYSKSCDITAELIDVGTGSKEEDFAGKDVKGKIILMEAPELFIPPLYVKKGAIGLILYPNPRKALGYRDLTNYNRFPVKKDILDETTYGFSIPFEKALYLKELLEKGPVKVHAKIDANIFQDKEMEVISAAIRGTEHPEEEIIISAHLCHAAAGANDNASGSAGLIEVARSLKALIENGSLSPPMRTIRFLWIPEFDGTWPWAKENIDRVKNALININLDMIGEHPMKIGEPFNICLSPFSRPSIFNDVLQEVVKLIADHPKGIAVNGTKVPMRYRILPFSGGSDHQVFIDSAVGIPGSMFGHHDPLWHTSLDTTEYSDSTELQRVSAIAVVTAYLFASLIGESIIDVWSVMEKGSYERLGQAKKKIHELFNLIVCRKENKESNKKKITVEEMSLLGTSMIDTASLYEKQILKSLERFGPRSSIINEIISIRNKEIDEWVKNQHSLWENLCQKVGFKIESLKESDTFKEKYDLRMLGLKNLEDLFPIALSTQFSKIQVPKPPKLWFGDLHELLNLIGCSYELRTICAMLTLEYDYFFYLSEVQKFIKYLIRKDVIKKY